MFRNFLQDLRHGIRLMRKNPGFSAAAALTIAVGIAASTAIFSVVYGVLLQPLPYREPGRLVSLWTRMSKLDLARGNVSAADYRDWRAQTRTLEDVALVRPVANFNLAGDGEPERLLGARSTANLLDVLGVKPRLGRYFSAENERPADIRVVVLSYGLWMRRFGADPAVVGRTIRLSGEPYTVLGVMGPEFRYPSREFQLWLPLYNPPDELQERFQHQYLAVGRLRRGTTLVEAQAEFDTISARLERAYPENAGTAAVLTPMLSGLVGPMEKPLYLLLGAVGCLLLIGCVNVANLFLARGVARGRERAVRVALGASSRRLAAQAAAEVIPTVGVGAILGVTLAAWSLRALVAALPESMPRVDEIAMSGPVLAFGGLLLLFTCLLVAFWPALQPSRGSLHQGVRAGTASRAGAQTREWLVVAEVALTVMLVAGAGLLARSFAKVKEVRTGFQAGHALTLHLAIPRSKYPGDRDVAAFAYRILERVRAVPGVEAAGMVNRLPIAGAQQSGPIEFEGRNLPLSRVGNADWRSATPGYFRAMGIPLIEGRTLAETDTEDSQPVAVIDERTARAVWPHQSAIGKRLRIPIPGAPWQEIVGVVARVRHDSLEAEPRPQVYWSYRQRMQDRMALVVRTADDPAAWTAAVVSQIRSLDAEQPVYAVATMEDVVDRSLTGRRLNALLVAVFAGVSLLLASIGIYGVMAYAVQQRVREFGIRIAVGANRQDVIGMVVLGGVRVGIVGSVIGLAAAAALGRVISALLYDTSATDWMSFTIAALVLLAVAVVASYVPARRAAACDPMQALRSE